MKKRRCVILNRDLITAKDPKQWEMEQLFDAGFDLTKVFYEQDLLRIDAKLYWQIVEGGDVK